MLKGFRHFIIRGNHRPHGCGSDRHRVVVVPMSRLLGRYSKPAVEELVLPSEPELLVEIRDLLRAQQRS